MEDIAICITAGEQSENHVGMQINGNGLAKSGFTIDDLLLFKTTLEEKKINCEYYRLDSVLEDKNHLNAAALLIIRNGVDYIINDNSKSMLKEQVNYEWDKKYWDTRRSKVLNKHARANVCFGEYNIEPNYEEKQGRIVAYKDVKYLDILRQNLCKMLGKKGENLICEGNRYFDIKKCGIGWHGDSERKKVIGLRLGEKMMFKIRWYFKCNAVSESINIELEDGDMIALLLDEKNQETSVEGVFVYRSESLVGKKAKSGWLDWVL